MLYVKSRSAGNTVTLYLLCVCDFHDEWTSKACGGGGGGGVEAPVAPSYGPAITKALKIPKDTQISERNISIFDKIHLRVNLDPERP